MRVAHISDCYLPRTGGIELQVRGLSQAQLASGGEPEIITATPAARGNPHIRNETDSGVPIHRLAVDLPGGLPITPYFGGRLRTLLRDGVDVVHVHGGLVSAFAWPALRTAVLAGTPAIVSVHSVWADWSRAFSAVNALAGWRRWPVVWTAVSEVAAIPLRHALAGAAEVHVLPNGIDVDMWRKPSVEDRNPDEVVVAGVARLAIRKRGQEFIQILADARAQLPARIQLRAVLVGDGPDRAKIEKSLSRREMDWVDLVGWQTHDQIRDLFGRADIFVNPARLESFGIAALEARTSGLPVVAYAGSGVSEFITDGREGLLSRDDAGLAAAIARLAVDAELRARITKHNRSTEPPFGWPTVTASAEQRYAEAIKLVRARSGRTR